MKLGMNLFDLWLGTRIFLLHCIELLFL